MTTTETGIEAVGEATLAELAEGLHGELVTPASDGVRRGPVDLERRARPAAGGSSSAAPASPT